MRPHNSFQRTRHIPIKLITLLACLLVLAILSSTVGRASANPTPENGPDLLRQRDPGTGQVAPEQDASLSDINVTVNGESVTLAPPFDPDTTHYTATVNSERVFFGASVTQPAAGIDQTSVGDETTSLDPPGATVTDFADLTEGAITTASVRVLASDGVTTKTYHLFLSRPADPAVPDITISADAAEYTAGLSEGFFTLRREGDTADSLDVTVKFTQEQPWLTDTAHTVTFAAGGAETIIIIVASGFSSSVTHSGDLTATVAAATGYDTSGAIAQIRVISQEGPAVTVQIEHSEYTFDEDAGTVDITLVARAHESVTQIGEFNVRVLSQPVTATPMNNDDPGDYRGLSESLRFGPADFQQEMGSLVGRKTVSLTILDDDVIEGDEYFHIHLREAPGSSEEIARLDSKGDRWDTTCSNPYVVTIRDNDHAVTVTIEHPAYTVDEDAGTLDITLVAHAHHSVSQVSAFSVTVQALAGQATSGNDDDAADYRALSDILRFAPSDFQDQNGSLVGRKTVSITILDDDTYEGDEQFHVTLGRAPGLASEVILLDPEGEPCGDECPNPYVVTIRDNDGSPVTVQFGQNAYTVAEGTIQGVIVTLSDDPERTVVIPITATDQGGATGADYSGVPQSVTFNTGETTQTISFAAAHDTIDDDGESVKLSFGSMLPAGVSEGPINEAVVSLTERKLTDYTEKPGISEPMCKPNGVFIFWHSAIKFEDDPPPYGWRVERRHLSNGSWITTRFDFLGAESDALQTFNDEYWDWTDTTHRSGVDYTYRVRPLDNDGEPMEERMWSRRAPALCR
ncbi:MAG: hypothetical protein OXF79_16910 [Chloroflexi bacterium]|nr:hypothetical protein [Chloroflexota bacterium]